ncbi:hypothetical protein L0668_11050 [Paraglaciecola aquimarina]|uniref:Uncharacterized protein n=1 Tax=Paraglaciecola algarum TaxID=3050085 RepID=A0ABS9D8E7_9ALTE|nr:hypothetical protein [Paraglaciecola sp. G1-23]MCF2948645.1 hypothetical protein [Paraglaciecola sp. G1-23]
MLSRRGFIVTGICSAVSHSAISSSISSTNTWISNTEHEQCNQALDNLSFKRMDKYKGDTLYLRNNETNIKVKIVDVHDMNSDYRLEQFSLSLEANDNSIDLNGVYQAQLNSDTDFVEFPISVIGNQADSVESKYFAVFSRIKSV